MEHDIEIDAIGLLCPLPVLRLQKRLRALAPGQVARLLATDPMAQIDVPHFCAEQGHELISVESDGPQCQFTIRKGSAPDPA
jgi:tRNA 2-thiouridine synthesizing protein A